MSSSALPTLNSRQVKELDRLAAERFGVSVDRLMEAAGAAVARFCDRPAVVVCGIGNNGGDGLVCARRLHEAGQLSNVCCVDPTRFTGPAANALKALEMAGVEVLSDLRLDGASLVVDAIFGVGISRPPQGPFAEWIEAINASRMRVVAVDVPSGLDADTGVAYSPCVRADVTITMGLPKQGLLVADGPSVAGEIWVVDIGIPEKAYESLGIEVPAGLFAEGSAVKL
ncbi:MAG TPA: NAD(P)H-hydrate epimerase [Candidatus Dormibacteraeota bacterium]|nr:NAD(P)H-hydrate epimerase [Candidatus Dormibacteraeota bacterium]